MPISLITCTGGRPEAFALLERWVAGQIFSGRFEWIVVDDCDPPTEVRMGQHVIRPASRWTPASGCTLGRNLAVGLAQASHDKILFLEDDEAYMPDYFESMALLLDHAMIAGEIPARYYHVGRRVFRVIDNWKHASLCQTGIRRAAAQLVYGLCTRATPFIDLELWRACQDRILVQAENVVSIKGLPGRPGVGVGHRPHGTAWTSDPDLAQLYRWLGREASLYAQFREAE